jgi:hypothetical protein
MSSAIDDHLAAALRSAGFPFESDDTGGAQILVSMENGRTQRIYVDAATTTFGDLELRKIWTGAYMSRDDLPRRTIDFVLAQNYMVPFGAWATFLEGGELFLVFEAKLPAVLSPDTFLEVIQLVGQVADAIESTLSTVDKL